MQVTMRMNGKERWHDMARKLVVQFDDAFPALRMCNHFVNVCHAEFPEVAREEFGRFMSEELRRYRNI